MTGQAEDGGLFLPAEIMNVKDQLATWQQLSYTDLAFTIMHLFIDDIPSGDLQHLIASSYSGFTHPEVAPTKAVGDLHILELFHGPTLAFKDYALQFLGNTFEYVLQQEESLNILVATSGDTGVAAIHGVLGRNGIKVFVMHPRNKIAHLQYMQMATVIDANIHNIAINGTFDDCQRLMKAVFADLQFKQTYNIGTMNSINWARILAQMVYYFYAYFRVIESSGKIGAPVIFSVPTGNFGNILSVYLAHLMGLPVAKLILATNDNDILTEFFNHGKYTRGTVHHTPAPAMDIQVASNFERYMYYFYKGDSQAVRQFYDKFDRSGCVQIDKHSSSPVDPLFVSHSINTEKIHSTIRSTWEKHGYLLDPHTAIGVEAAKNYIGNVPVICLSTAHPAKFPQVIDAAIGQDLARHPQLQALEQAKHKCTELPADIDAVMDFLRQHA